MTFRVLPFQAVATISQQPSTGVPRELVADAARAATELDQNRPPFWILSREIDGVVNAARALSRQPSWNNARTLRTRLMALRTGALGYRSASSNEIRTLDAGIRRLENALRAAGERL